jgi:hypothetical protein
VSNADAPPEPRDPRLDQVDLDPVDLGDRDLEGALDRVDDPEVTADHQSHALARLERVAPARRRRIDAKLLAASMGIAVGLVAIVLGFLSAQTGTGDDLLPEPIESIDPVRGATQVPQQTRVFVDLQVGYEGVLIIDGIELPVVSLDDIEKAPPGLGDTGGDQVEIPPGVVFEPGNATLTFEPGPSQVIEAFTTGQHSVTVRYWRTIDGPGTARIYSWSFYAV